MTSREIAELTGKDHAHVMRDIRVMLDALEKDASSFGGIYLDAYRREKPCFNLDRELTLTLVSGYDVTLRHRVITRLQELELAQGNALVPPNLARDRVQAQILLDIGESMAKVTGVDPAIAFTYSLDAISTKFDLDTSSFRKALPAAQPREELMNPTQVGKELGISALRVNRLLVEAGLQSKDARGDYIMSEEGAKYGEAFPYTRRGHSGFQLMWKKSVMGVLESRA